MDKAPSSRTCDAERASAERRLGRAALLRIVAGCVDLHVCCKTKRHEAMRIFSSLRCGILRKWWIDLLGLLGSQG